MDDGQPERMELLAELLAAGIHPRLDAALAAATATATATAVRDEAVALRAAHDAARIPRARAGLVERIRTALARSAQIELAQRKRRYQAEGFSEAEIHAVIPDRPTGAPAPTPTPAPTPA